MAPDKFDRMFDEAFDAAVRESQRTSIPSPDPSWERIRRLLEAQKKRSALIRKFSMLGAIVASLLIGALLFGQAQVTDAFQPFTKFFKDDALSFFKGVSEPTGAEALTAPPPTEENAPPGNAAVSSGGSAEQKITVYSLEEAKKLSRIPVFQPALVPEGYKLSYIYLFMDKSKQVSRVYQRYENDEGKYYRFEQTNQSLDSWLTHFFNKENSKLEDVTIGDEKAKKMTDPKGKLTLIWTYAAGTVSLSGNTENSVLMELVGINK
ncbi:DUF4367 domain-containing protein [Paenibacillus sp. MBLB4367]|uniref:DUF4367 domain-containing protein n=1 Tax=Paenibacillus sp. MBLB4367 TaxID=3384767 RepID=UPI00390806E2